MPDEPTPGLPWWKDVKSILLIITAITSMVTTINTQCTRSRVDHGFEHVAQRQEEQVQTAAVIKADLNEAAAITEKKLDRIAEKTADVKNSVQVIDSKLPKK